MRLRHIEIFHAVMRAGSVSGAAELLNLSQSAASKALIQAEQSLGLTLFERVRGRLISTREAKHLFEHTTLLFAQAETVQRLARNLRRSPGGHLRIGCLPSIGIGLIPAAVKDLRTRCTDISIDITTGNGVELAEQCLRQDIDVAVVFESPLSLKLRSTPLGQARAVHVEAGKRRQGEPAVELAKLNRANWIGIGGSDPLAQRIFEIWNPLQPPEPVPAFETRTHAVACALASQGLGFALVDEFTAIAMGVGLRIRPTWPEVSVGVVALQDIGAQGSAALTLLLASVASRLQAGGSEQPVEKE